MTKWCVCLSSCGSGGGGATPTLTPFARQGHFFPEITKDFPRLKEILDEEEASFSRTLDRGEKLFETYVADAVASGRTELAGDRKSVV